MKKLGLITIILVILGAFVSVKAQTVNEEKLEIRQYDAKNGCLQMPSWNKDAIQNQYQFLKRVRNDARREKCLNELEKIDFDKNELYGNKLNTGYCGYPLELEFTAVKNLDYKQFVIKISYLKPTEVCKAESSFDLWIVLPDPPRDYGVRFEIAVKEKN